VARWELAVGPLSFVHELLVVSEQRAVVTQGGGATQARQRIK